MEFKFKCCDTATHLQSGVHFKNWDDFRKALSLAHNLKKFRIWEGFQQFCNTCVDFLSLTPDDSPGIIGTMHQLTLLVIGNMAKYYDAGHVGMVVEHGLRFCVASSVYGLRMFSLSCIRSDFPLHGRSISAT